MDGQADVPTESSDANASKRMEIALKQYDILIGHLRFDQTTFWTRFGFMLLSQVTLYGFFLNALQAKDFTPWTGLLTRLLVCGLALGCVYYFDRIRRISQEWVNYELQKLTELEAEAFGNKVFLRAGHPAGGMREAAARIFAIIAGIWVVAIGVSIWHAVRSAA